MSKLFIMSLMQKQNILKTLLNQVTDAIKLVDIAISEAQEAANEHKGQMESRYDSAKEEAQAMVIAQSKRKAALLESLATLQKIMDNESLLKNTHNKVQIASIIKLTNENDYAITYFICPVNGGDTLNIEGEKVTILSPTSPLGLKTLGKETDDDFTFKIRGVETEFYISSIL